MSINRSWAIGAIALTLLAVLPIGSMAGAAAAKEQITLTVLNYLDATSPNAERELEEIWGAFEKNNPDIKLVREDLFNEPFHQKTAAYIAAGKLPDVIYMWPGGRSSVLHDQKLVKDLTPLLGKTRSEFNPAALVPQAGGYLAELPNGITATHVLYTNKAMLDSLGLTIPKTYAQLKAMVPKLKAAGKDVILMGAKDDWVIQSTLFSMIVGRLVGDKGMDAIIAGKAKFTDAPFMNALNFYQQLYTDGILTKKNLQTAYNEVNGLWASGQAPFLVDGDWKCANFLTDPTTGKALIPPDMQKNFVMTIFPEIPGEIVHQTTATVVGTGWGINAKIPAGSDKEEAAWRLVQWLESPQVQKIRLETGAAFPSRKNVTSSKLEPLAQERVRFYDSFDGTYVLDNVLDAKVYSPLNIGLQEIGLGIATPKEVATRVQQAMDAWRKAQ